MRHAEMEQQPSGYLAAWIVNGLLVGGLRYIVQLASRLQYGVVDWKLRHLELQAVLAFNMKRTLMRSRTQLAIAGAAAAALTSVAILANGGFILLPSALPGISTEARAVGARMSAREAEAQARVGAQQQIDRVTAAASGSGRAAGEPVATIRGKPVAAAEMTLVESKFFPAVGAGQPVPVTSEVTGSKTAGDRWGGATWLFVFRSTQVDRPTGVQTGDWVDGAIEVEVVLSDETGKASSETLWTIADLGVARK